MFKESVLEIVLNDIISEVKLKDSMKHDYEMQYARLITELTTMIDPNTGMEPCITINEKIFGDTRGSGFRMTSSKIYTWKGIADTSSITVHFNKGYKQELLDFGYTEEEVMYLEKILEVIKEHESEF
ncbi:hypothetical protein [Yersinia phage fHe-Yen9-04]|uniref:Uncharacterized protein n=1 Tax=Yersinia phage fHe-Yen9-04 TaxID=2052742 RepID=A0A2C9CY13_9CAUD|nr:hypothetical protein FDJ41_gp443 [Yersinia phage fHe-Yen9-04]SOK58737.1 hypothetical protein [Yersinia phage fHe-Yen9-04]VUE36506.1 hypothetical protein [Yersinia phage fHe-Yen9-04]